ncbi:tripartite tricarboxylate transporter substrate-binding protein [Noviherbaspirillum aerium]|uniref:tripartite tricarboxylate transporter substrate-binding protein n=1 Tax=Noviherbaspirillum aerium TaxID=2588497 RepID=UPI00124D3506|nr:tripartite tricarboxylate transporter substrate-binding protein [Noviherbaspirillum aerium]
MIFRKLILAPLLLAAASAAMAETWPSKPIRFVVAAPGGSSLDIIARTISDKLGNGSSSHLTMELFKTMTSSFIVHIPYNGAPPAALSLLSGETQILFSVPSVIMPQIKTGKIKALAVTSPIRFSLLPDLPTVAEAGLPGFESITWNGVLVPRGTPADIVQRLNTDIDAILKQADVKARFNNAGLDTAGGTPDAFRTLIAAEAKKWEPIIRRTGAKID